MQYCRVQVRGQAWSLALHSAAAGNGQGQYQDRAFPVFYDAEMSTMTSFIIHVSCLMPAIDIQSGG